MENVPLVQFCWIRLQGSPYLLSAGQSFHVYPALTHFSFEHLSRVPGCLCVGVRFVDVTHA